MGAPSSPFKVLAPVDCHRDNRGVLSLVQYMVNLHRGGGYEVVLLHAMAPSYLEERLANIDLRARELADSNLIRSLREAHIDREIRPRMEELKGELVAAGLDEGSVSVVIRDGDPVDVITQAVKEERFQLVALQRSCRSPLVEAVMGGVTSSLLLRRLPCPIYVVGARLWDGVGQEARLMAAVDGSPHAMRALEEAAAMARFMGRGFRKLYICHVSELLRKVRGDLVFDPEKLQVEGDAILQAAAARARELGVAEEALETIHRVGRADEALAQAAQEKGIDILFLGRKGATALEEVFVGSVCRSILHRCVEPTVALVG